MNTITEAQAEAAVNAQLDCCEVHAANPKAHATFAATAPGTSARSLVQALVGAGVDWKTILFKALPLILMLIPGGQPFAVILEQILAALGVAKPDAAA